MSKRALRWSLLMAAAMFASGVAVQLSKPLLPEGWSELMAELSADLKLAVGASLLLAVGAYLMGILFPPQDSPLMGSRFWVRAVLVVCVANFLVFVLVASAIGGDALNGYAEHGHYFLRNHTVVTEVSQSVFIYSRWHAVSTFVTHPVGIVAAWMLQSDIAHDSF
ncbi:MAG TPA: hypothetical protein VH475_29745 [Tepidisphaeraceae bacterium]|jgi:hypothetical protein